MPEDNLKLNLDLNSGRAKEELSNVNQSLGEVEKKLKAIKDVGSFDRVEAKNIDEYVSAIVKAQKEMGKLYTSANSRKERFSAPRGQSRKDTERNALKNSEAMGRVNKELVSEMRKILNRFADYNTKEGGHPRYFGENLNRHSYTPSNSSQQLRSAQNEQRTLQNELTRTERQLKSAKASGNISDYQAKVLKDSLNSLLGTYQGANTEEDRQKLLKGEDWFVDSNSMRSELADQIDELNKEGTDLKATLEGLNNQFNLLKDNATSATSEEEHNQTVEAMESLQSVIKTVEADLKNNEATVEKTQDTIETLNDSIQRLTKLMGTPDSPYSNVDDIRVRPDSGTLEGFLETRSTTLGIMMVNAITNSLQSSYAGGASVTESQRPDSLTIGTSLGGGDYRHIRREARDAGRGAKVSGEEILTNADSYSRHVGFDTSTQSPEEIREQMFAAADAIAQGQRTTGVSNEQWQALTGVAMETGAASDTQDLQALQDAFVGAIQMSGMEGREKEQIDALTGILDQVSDGRGLSSEQLANQMALTNLLSSTGSRSLQGENLGQNLGSLNSAIQGADMFSDIGFMMGVGTNPRYSGPEGRYNYMVDRKEGLAGEAGMSLVENALAYNNNNAQAAAAHLAELTGADVMAVEEIMKLYQSGELNSENLKELGRQAQEQGSTEVESRKEAFDSSSDADELALQNAEESIQANTHDNSFTAALRNVAAPFMSALGGTMIGSLAAAGGGGLTKGLGGLGKAASGNLIGELISKYLGGSLGEIGKGVTQSKLGKGLSAAKGAITNSSLWKTISEAGSKVAGSADDVVGGLGKAAKSATTNPKLLEGVTKGGNAVAKAAPWVGAGVQLVTGLGDVVNAEEGTKGEATGELAGEVGGSLLGGAGGAKLGAAIGTLIAPGIGTAIGGALGGVGGSLLGEKALGKAGGWLGSFFDGDKEPEPSEEERGVGNASSSDGMSDIDRRPVDKQSAFPNLGGIVKGLFTGGASNLTKGLLGGPITGVGGALSQMGGDLGKGMSSLYSGEGYAGQEDTALTQDEKATSDNRLLAEEMRKENSEYEEANLGKLEQLLKEMRKILMEARTLQFGGGLGGGSGVGGELQYTSEGQYWTNSSDLTRHDLAYTSNTLTAGQLDDWINSVAPSDSAMRGLGETFMEAGRQSGLDPRYLVAHAAHETGWGTSQIMTDKNNWYGIGAFDDSPYASAYSYNSKEGGIIEGAKWIAENYYQAGQTDLHSMRFNNGVHEYATDPGWADKIARTMKGSENYSQPSNNISVTTNVSVGEGRSNRETGRAVGEAAGNATAKIIEQTIDNIWTTDFSRAQV